MEEKYQGGHNHAHDDIVTSLAFVCDVIVVVFSFIMLLHEKVIQLLILWSKRELLKFACCQEIRKIDKFSLKMPFSLDYLTKSKLVW